MSTIVSIAVFRISTISTSVLTMINRQVTSVERRRYIRSIKSAIYKAISIRNARSRMTNLRPETEKINAFPSFFITFFESAFLSILNYYADIDHLFMFLKNHNIWIAAQVNILEQTNAGISESVSEVA